MPCYFPIYINHGIKVTDRVAGKTQSAPDSVPCGKCMGCIKANALKWATRCYHESRMHEKNCFVTLTYDDQYLPENGTLVKYHMQQFLKNLRYHYGEGIRFYGVGEYGEKLDRPHYHLLLFNHQFPDLKIWKLVKKNKILYLSESCSEIWGKGHITVGSLEMDSAMYCALYAQKKVTGPEARAHYGEKIPEFALMSRDPGIGNAWIKKYTSDTFKGFFTINRQKYATNSYYDRFYAKKMPKEYQKAKAERRRLAEKHDMPIERRCAVNEVKKIIKARKAREIHDRSSLHDSRQEERSISSTAVPHE